MFYDLKQILQMQKLQEMLRPQDKDLMTEEVQKRFWMLIDQYLQEKITNLKEMIYNGGRNEELSKLKWNDKDLNYVAIEVLEEIRRSPLRIKTLIDNTEFSSNEKTKKVQS